MPGDRARLARSPALCRSILRHLHLPRQVSDPRREQVLVPLQASLEPLLGWAATAHGRLSKLALESEGLRSIGPEAAPTREALAFFGPLMRHTQED